MYSSSIAEHPPYGRSSRFLHSAAAALFRPPPGVSPVTYRTGERRTREGTVETVRPHLPPTGSHPGGRSALTCRFRCGDACFHEVPDTSGNPYFGEVLARALSRRAVLGTAVVVTLASAAGASVPPASEARAAGGGSGHGTCPGDGAKGLRFTPVPPNTADRVTVPPGYRQNIVIRWGEPILRGAPAFDAERQSVRARARQFGYHNDFLSLLPLEREGGVSARRQILVANHEYTDEVLKFRGYEPDAPTREQVEIAWAAHGLSVVVVGEDRRRGALTPMPQHALNRRLTATSEFLLTGSAAGSEPLRTSADRSGRRVRGTLDNCAGGDDAVGHDPARRGELPPVLRPRPLGDPQAVRHRHRGERTQVGTLRPALRRVARAERAAPLRLGRRTRPVRPGLHPAQAHRAGPLQARGGAAEADRRRAGRRLRGR